MPGAQTTKAFTLKVGSRTTVHEASITAQKYFNWPPTGEPHLLYLGEEPMLPATELFSSFVRPSDKDSAKVSYRPPPSRRSSSSFSVIRDAASQKPTPSPPVAPFFASDPSLPSAPNLHHPLLRAQSEQLPPHPPLSPQLPSIPSLRPSSSLLTSPADFSRSSSAPFLPSRLSYPLSSSHPRFALSVRHPALVALGPLLDLHDLPPVHVPPPLPPDVGRSARAVLQQADAAHDAAPSLDAHLAYLELKKEELAESLRQADIREQEEILRQIDQQRANNARPRSPPPPYSSHPISHAEPFSPSLLADPVCEALFLQLLAEMDASSESIGCAIEKFGPSNSEQLRSYARRFSALQGRGFSAGLVKHGLSVFPNGEECLPLLTAAGAALATDAALREDELIHALEIYPGDLQSALKLVQSSRTLQNMGFSSQQASQSLLLHQLDIDRALAELIPNSPY